MSRKKLTEEERLVRNRGYRKKWYLKHRSTILEKWSKYKKEHKNDPDYKRRKKESRERSKEKDLIRTTLWRSNNIDRVNKTTFKNHLKNYYNITVEEYNIMLEKQDGVCFICNKSNTNGYHLCVDHDHKTGEIRGLLCITCNRNLGWHEKYLNNINKYLMKCLVVEQSA